MRLIDNKQRIVMSDLHNDMVLLLNATEAMPHEVLAVLRILVRNIECSFEAEVKAEPKK